MQKMNPDRKNSEHIADHDLERYHLGMIVGEIELAPLEEHLLACSDCAERAQATADYIDLIRRVTIVPTIGARAVGYVRAAAVFTYGSAVQAGRADSTLALCTSLRSGRDPWRIASRRRCAGAAAGPR